MARDRNTFAKRLRESGKKLKAADKRARRLKRKENAKDAEGPDDRASSER
jgi:hypothetical protein